MRILDDLILESNDEELIKNYFEYCEKMDKAPAPGSFIVCGTELSKILEEVLAYRFRCESKEIKNEKT